MSIVFHFSMPKCHQAINIMAIQSFWIIKPLRESVPDALNQFKSHGYAKQLKTQITPQSIALVHEDLLAFLHDQIINIWKLLSICMYFIYNLDPSWSILLFYSFFGRVHHTFHLPHVILFMYLYFQHHNIQVNIMDLTPLCTLVQHEGDIIISKTCKFRVYDISWVVHNEIKVMFLVSRG